MNKTIKYYFDKKEAQKIGDSEPWIIKDCVERRRFALVYRRRPGKVLQKRVQILALPGVFVP